MLETLKLVRGSVSTKDLMPVLTHFLLMEGEIRGFNGRMAITAPAPDLHDIAVTVPAEPFLRAVDACGEKVKLKTTKDGRLEIRGPSLRVTLPTGNTDDFPLLKPEGKKTKLDFPLLTHFAKLQPFIGDDASRAWSCGILIKDGACYTTNNIVLAKTNLGGVFPHLNLPVFVVNELVRIGLEPEAIYTAKDSITFMLPDGVWIRSQLFDAAWPKEPEDLLPKAVRKTPLPAGLKEAVERVLPFCPDPHMPIIHFDGEKVRTAEGQFSAEVTGFNLPAGAYQGQHLLAVLAAATSANFKAYPIVPWQGDGVQGIIIGVSE